MFNNPLKYTDPSGYLSTAYYLDGMRIESHEVPISAEGSGVTFGTGNVVFTEYSYQTKDGRVSSWSRDAIWNYYNKSDYPLYTNRFPKMIGETNGFNGNTYVSRNQSVIITASVGNSQTTQSINGIGLQTHLQIIDGFGIAVAVAREVALEYRDAQPMLDKIGMSNNLKLISLFGTMSKYIGVAGYGVTAISTIFDYNKIKNGQMSSGRFGYNWWARQMGVYINNVENGLKNGWIPGR